MVTRMSKIFVNGLESGVTKTKLGQYESLTKTVITYFDRRINL